MSSAIRCLRAARAFTSGSIPPRLRNRRISPPAIMSRTYTGVRMDKTKNLDFSLFKNFQITERFRLAFRAEAFNLTNTPVFGAPGTTVNGANFGIITGQSNTPRNVQLGLKLVF